MRKLIRWVLFGFGICLVFFLIFFSGALYEWTCACSMQFGPIYGETYIVDQENLILDQEIPIPNGKFGLQNLNDTKSPKLIRFDENGQIVWAIKFEPDADSHISFNLLTEMSLEESESGKSLFFFNRGYGEPGRIYLTDDYDFKYMCLLFM